MKLLVNDENPAIILICETWLNDSHEFKLENFKVYRRDRIDGNGGGVLICVRDDIPSEGVDIHTVQEICFIRIKINSKIIKVGTAYRPPSQSIENTISFTNQMRDLLQYTSNYVVLGDLNFPGINWSQGSTSNTGESYFYNILNELGATQMIDEPTTEYDSLLDLCICSSDTIASNVEVGEIFSSTDHSIITCNLSMPFEKQDNRPSMVKIFRNVDWDLVRAHIATVNWETFFADCKIGGRFMAKVQIMHK